MRAILRENADLSALLFEVFFCFLLQLLVFSKAGTSLHLNAWSDKPTNVISDRNSILVITQRLHKNARVNLKE